jgi:hypothetical protein
MPERATEPGPKPGAPLPDTLMCDQETALGEDQLDIAQTEDVIQRRQRSDDLGGESVAWIGDRAGIIPSASPRWGIPAMAGQLGSVLAEPEKSRQRDGKYQHNAGSISNEYQSYIRAEDRIKNRSFFHKILSGREFCSGRNADAIG